MSAVIKRYEKETPTNYTAICECLRCKREFPSDVFEGEEFCTETCLNATIRDEELAQEKAP